jgi:hypothetical protein
MTDENPSAQSTTPAKAPKALPHIGYGWAILGLVGAIGVGALLAAPYMDGGPKSAHPAPAQAAPAQP